MTRGNLDGTRLFFAIASLLVCTNRMVAGQAQTTASIIGQVTDEVGPSSRRHGHGDESSFAGSASRVSHRRAGRLPAFASANWHL